MTPLHILGIGLCAPGMEDWGRARSVLRGECPYAARPLAKLDIPMLPVTERRRVNATSRLAIHAAMQAVAHLPAEARARLPSVFASADGDGAVLANTLDALAQQPVTMSPTLFHNSVFNAPSGYWTIASQATAASITISAGAGTFAAGLLEAGIQALVARMPVLYVACDMAFPESLRAFAVEGSAFACALLLGPSTSAASGCGQITGWERPLQNRPPHAFPALSIAHFRGNPSAAALPLLEAVARGTPASFALPYLDGGSIDLAYLP